ncbi:MAG: hypothetical protein A3B70_08130 [Deltaproteobacteria bacterium RIFCSPHIGHO2_02_FULL_40_11]|nr:MAG: hypothetical protein A3B70_08130 [Deltaproteobacteria bacterium RIFCSPHIGHO2_02_FULL_40_11]
MVTLKSKTEGFFSQKKEVWTVLFLCIFVFLAASLFSYHPTDPSFNSVSSSKEVQNLTGLVGSYTSDFLFQTFGLSAYIILALLLFFRRGWLKSFGFLLLIVFTAGFFSLLLKTITLQDQKLLAGGITGHVLISFLHPYFNTTGTYIVILCGFFMTLITTLNFSFVSSLHFIFRGIPTIFSNLTFPNIWRLIRNRFKWPFRKKASKPKVVTYETKIPEDLVYEDDPEDINEDTPPQGSEAIEYEADEPEEALGEEKLEYEEDELDENDEGIEYDAPDEILPEQEPVIVDTQANLRKKKKSSLSFEYFKTKGNFKLPSLKMLADPENETDVFVDKETLLENSSILEQKLKDFNIEGNVVQVRPGPVITVYEFQPAAGIKVSRIVNLADDLSLALSALSVRIVAPIPGKNVVGIELPNDHRHIISLKEILLNNEFRSLKYRLPLALGKSISGEPCISDLARMPHLLVAGATGSGKSVFINSIISSFLFRYTPEQLRFIMIDPKMLELSMYDRIPHLLLPVVTDPKKAALALKWGVEEMEKRYTIMSKISVRNIDSYNKKIETASKAELEAIFEKEIAEDGTFEIPDQLPYVVIVIDELADLMMVASKDVEISIARLTQMARAAGIHLLVATQRPSVDVLTGLIKANFPARISFQTSTKVDSRTILDTIGAEKLLGSGDMLFLKPGTSRLVRIHGAYVSDAEIKDVVDFLKEQGEPNYNEEILTEQHEDVDFDFTEEDESLYEEAVQLVSKMKYASISMIQRRLRIGYNRAARMIEQMEAEGIVGPQDGAKPREVLVSKHP